MPIALIYSVALTAALLKAGLAVHTIIQVRAGRYDATQAKLDKAAYAAVAAVFAALDVIT